jgi:hypothetical protein
MPALTVPFATPHSSEPSFRRGAVQPGDLLYPIGVCDEVLIDARQRQPVVSPGVLLPGGTSLSEP